MSSCMQLCSYRSADGASTCCRNLIQMTSVIVGILILVNAVASVILGTLTLSAVAFRSLVGICLLASGIAKNFCYCFIPIIFKLGALLASPPATPITAAVMPMVVK